MTALTLHPYQLEAIDAVEQAWAVGITRPAVVLPTGTGKTVMFTSLAHKEVRAGGRPLVLVHRDELVTQTVAKVHAIDPDLTVGVVKAERNETDADVIVASVQTLSRASRMDRLLGACMRHPITLVIVDEAHHAAANSYRDVLRWLNALGSEHAKTRTLGVSATLARTDGKGLGDVWQDVVYEKDILWAILNGYLVDVRGKSVTLDGLDLASVARSRGDYQDGSLAEALLAIDAGRHIAEAYRTHAGKRQGIMFCPNIETTNRFAYELAEAGIPCAVIIGDTDTAIRQETYLRYERKEIQVLVSCAVLTEGFDMPQAEVCVIARPTQSAPLYVQMVGRVLRTFPGKADALVLDVVGAAATHTLAGLVDLTTETDKAPREGESLLEQVERTTADEKLREAAHQVGKLGAGDVDLFHRSRAAWLQTPGGVWFIPTESSMFFLWPSQTTGFRVGRKGKTGKAVMLKDELTLDLAMSWAEQLATDEDPSVSSRMAAWRRRRTPPSPEQWAFAASLGLSDLDPTMSRAQLSDLISIEIASRVFDKHVSR